MRKLLPTVCCVALVALLATPSWAGHGSRWKSRDPFTHPGGKMIVSAVNLSTDFEFDHFAGSVALEGYKDFPIGIEVAFEALRIDPDRALDWSGSPMNRHDDLKVSNSLGASLKGVYRWAFLYPVELIARAGFEVHWMALNEYVGCGVVCTKGEDWNQLDSSLGLAPSASLGLGVLAWYWRPSFELTIVRTPEMTFGKMASIPTEWLFLLQVRLLSFQFFK